MPSFCATPARRSSDRHGADIRSKAGLGIPIDFDKRNGGFSAFAVLRNALLGHPEKLRVELIPPLGDARRRAGELAPPPGTAQIRYRGRIETCLSSAQGRSPLRFFWAATLPPPGRGPMRTALRIGPRFSDGVAAGTRTPSHAGGAATGNGYQLPKQAACLRRTSPPRPRLRCATSPHRTVCRDASEHRRRLRQAHSRSGFTTRHSGGRASAPRSPPRAVATSRSPSPGRLAALRPSFLLSPPTTETRPLFPLPPAPESRPLPPAPPCIVPENWLGGFPQEIAYGYPCP